MLYEALPIDLVLVLFTRILLSDLKNLDELPHREASPLARDALLLFNAGIHGHDSLRVRYLHQLVMLRCWKQDTTGLDTVKNPIERVNLPWIIHLWIRLLLREASLVVGSIFRFRNV